MSYYFIKNEKYIPIDELLRKFYKYYRLKYQ